MNKGHITLTEALKSERLQDFIKQQSSQALKPVSKRQFDALVKTAVTAPQPQGRTSGSRALGNSSGKKTR